MRQNPSFTLADVAEMRRVIENNPWASIVTATADGQVARLVERFERRLPEPRLRWERPNDEAFVHRLAAGTVGFRLTPTRVVAKRKLSQNKDAATVENIIAELQGDGVYANAALAAEMRRAQGARPGRTV